MKIEDIFELKTKNQIKIIKCISENNGIINFEKISKSTALDTKTVRSFWADIELYLDEKQQIATREDYLKVRIKIYQDSWVYNLFERLFLDNGFSVISFLSEFYLSESTFRRKIHDINKLLKSKNLKIVSRKGNLKIKGHESQIRYLASQYFWTIFKGIYWPFDNIEYDKIYTLLEKVIFKPTKAIIKDTTYVEWSYILAINLIRFNKGFRIEKEEFPDFTFELVYSFKNTTITNISTYLSQNFHLPELEQIYIFLLFQMRPQFYFEESLLEMSINTHKKLNTDVYLIFKYVLDFFSDKIVYKEGILFAKAYILSANMTATMIKGFFRPLPGYGLESFFNDLAPNLLKTIDDLIDQMIIQYPKNTFLKENKYLRIKYAEAYSLINSIMSFEKKILIGVITDLNSSLEKLLVEKLKSYFYLVKNVEFLTVYQTRIDKFDIVIKTSITLEDKAKQGEKIIIINPSLPPRDIKIISDTINLIS